MWWVLCNVCFIRPNHGIKKRFFITTCLHILCDGCLDATYNVCKKCGQKCSLIECNNQAPTAVRELFLDIPESKIKKLSDAQNFQKKHRTRLYNYFSSISSKYKMAKQIITKNQKDLEILLTKYDGAKQQIKKKDEQIEILLKKLRAFESHYSSKKIMENYGSPFLQRREESQYTDYNLPQCNLASSSRNSYTPISTPRNFPRIDQSGSSVFITPDSMRSASSNSSSAGPTPVVHQSNINLFTPNLLPNRNANRNKYPSYM